MDCGRVATHFQSHAAGLAGDSAVIALDGKALRGSLDRFEDTRAAQVLSAFAVGERIVLGQVLVEDADKDHEIQAAQRLIETLGLSGRLYTLDVLHLQKKVEAVLATGSDLLVQLKANPPKLLAAVWGVCQVPPLAERAYPVDLGRRNRIEQRSARVWPLPAGTRTEPWHDHFKAVVEVRRKVECFDPGLRRFVTRKEPVTYYLTTRAASAPTLAQALHRIGQLYAAEAEARALDIPARRRLRAEHALPELESLRAWLAGTRRRHRGRQGAGLHPQALARPRPLRRNRRPAHR